MPRLHVTALLLFALLIHSAWAQGRPAPNQNDEGMVPRAFFTGSPIAGRIECGRSWECSVTDGSNQHIFWYADMRGIPNDQTIYIADHCDYTRTKGCPAHYQIYAEFPFLKVVVVTLDELPLPQRRE